LQEFDKVFIQVSKDRSSITAGDYELNRPKSYFVNYFKQVQGLSAYYEANSKENLGLKSRASFAVSRAKFNRFQIEAIEANQGPYKLPGGNGERFIIIEAGSEKIYEDGRLLTRGQNHDYIISYDRAEIIFTEKKLITKDSRIIAEYEYVDRSYLRTMYAAEAEYKFKKLDLNFNYYSQQDSRSVSADGELDSLDLVILQNSGDNLAEARRSGIRMIAGEFDNSTITYKLLDNNILEYSTNPDSAFYIANFTEVGLGEGDYIIDTEVNANGRVYAYAGQGMGNYIAEVQLVAPQKNQIFSLAANYHPTEKTNVLTEVSLSNNDLNRFSSINNDDNQGLAAYFKLDHELSVGKSGNTKLQPFISLEKTQRDFKALNPYRAVEFQRNWNLKNNLIKANEQFLISGFKLKNQKSGDLHYSFSTYKRDDVYRGEKHDLNYKFKALGFEFTSTSSLLTSIDTTEKTNFLRPILGVARLLGKAKNPWKIGYIYEAEKNDRKSVNNDLFIQNSAAFRVNRYYLNSPKLKKFQSSIAYENRIDDGIKDEKFTTFAEADDLILSGKWHPSSQSLLNVDFTYRELKIADQDLADEKNVLPKKSYLGQVDYAFNVFNGFLKSTSSFTIGSGQQAKIEYDYQEVQPGEGNFDWIDVNMDGIQQLGEFRQSEFQDTSRFVQVPLYNNEFIQTNNSGINQSLRLDGKSLFKPRKKKKKKEDPKGKENETSKQKEKKQEVPKQVKTEKQLAKEKRKKKRTKNLKGTVGRLSLISTIRLNKKVEIDETDYNPLNFSIMDTSIVAFNSFSNHTLFINRGNPKWDGQIGQRKNQKSA